MRRITDEFLLHVAEFSVTTIGLFIVGVFFYAETGFRRWSPSARRAFEPYLRASVRIVLIVFAIPLGLALTLVALDPVWARITFVLLSIALVAANVETAARIRAVVRGPRSTGLLLHEVAGTVAAVAIVVTPWALGGLHPQREDFVWAILLSFGIGFTSVGALVLSTFDAGRLTGPNRIGEPHTDRGTRRTRYDPRRRRRVRGD